MVTLQFPILISLKLLNPDFMINFVILMRTEKLLSVIWMLGQKGIFPAHFADSMNACTQLYTISPCKKE